VCITFQPTYVHSFGKVYSSAFKLRWEFKAEVEEETTTPSKESLNRVTIARLAKGKPIRKTPHVKTQPVVQKKQVIRR
jgi:hypothetical protein